MGGVTEHVWNTYSKHGVDMRSHDWKHAYIWVQRFKTSVKSTSLPPWPLLHHVAKWIGTIKSVKNLFTIQIFTEYIVPIDQTVVQSIGQTFERNHLTASNQHISPLLWHSFRFLFGLKHSLTNIHVCQYLFHIFVNNFVKHCDLWIRIVGKICEFLLSKWHKTYREQKFVCG